MGEQQQGQYRQQDPVPAEAETHPSIVEGGAIDDAARFVPVGILGVLLLVSSWWDSAFDLRYWSLLAILALALLAAQVLSGVLELPRRGPVAVATAGIWALAAWVLLTAAWSQTAAGAWEEAARTAFYAAVWTVAVGSGALGAWRARLGGALAAGIAVAGAVALFAVVADGPGQFLAGRLDSPVGYRNGTAALFALGAWPLIGYAARRGGSTAMRSGAFAATGLLLSLAFVTQSRGVVIGLVAGGAVSLAIGPDRLRRAWLAILVLVPVAALSGSLLTPYDAFVDNEYVVTATDVHSASTAAILVTLVCFLVGAVLFVYDNGLRGGAADRLRPIAAAGLVAVVVLGAGVAIAKVGDPVHYLDSKVKEFNEDEASTSNGSTRLGSVGGQRSDLWRVAWDQFEDHPVAGAGAGSYEFAYYRDRHTDRNLDDAHSLPLRLLADTGLVGALLFFVWLVGAGTAVARLAGRVGEGERVWVAGLSAAAATVLAQCALDWLWLLPGLVGLAFLAAGLAAGGAEERPRPRSAWSPARIAAAALLAAALVSVAFLFLGDLYVRKARVARYSSAAKTLSDAETAAFFDPVSVTPPYLQAGALETEGRLRQARAKLEDARELEPDNFVTYGLLGDFEVRRGNDRAARGFYRQALALNPEDTGLRKLSQGAE
jgi:hypothetical protein